MTGSPHTAAGEFPLPEHPDVPDGLRAYAQPSHPDGSFDHDRAGRPKVRRVQLRASPPIPPERPDGLLTDSDWAWATSARRQWKSIVNRLDDCADQAALTLARAGCVALDHDYHEGTIRFPPRGWVPHPELATAHARRKSDLQAARQALGSRAEELRHILGNEWPGVAKALTAPAADPRLAWLVRAAEDLLAEQSHDGPRAFVQHHAKNTKAREDLPRMLADAGFEPEVLALLGINRNPYIGVGGPIRICHEGRTLDWSGWPGPHDIRLPAHRAITLNVAPGTQILLIIENRQAAETICDNHPDVAVIWCHGQPPNPLLDLINQASIDVHQVLICPDADLGGIHIAARVHDHLPPETSRTIVDIGTAGHDRGESFSPTTRDRIAAIAERRDAVGSFAAGCLNRGYAIEQEAPARSAVQRSLVTEHSVAIGSSIP